jgi:hypothetical protein
MPATMKRNRRSTDDLIADLEAELAAVKAQAERKKVKKDPSLRHISSALRSIEAALEQTEDSVTRGALGEARATLSACLSLNGAAPAKGHATLSPRPRSRRVASVDPAQVLEYLAKHAGARSEEMAAELGTDTAALRPILHRLRDEGRIRVEGKARATRYSLAERGDSSSGR